MLKSCLGVYDISVPVYHLHVCHHQPHEVGEHRDRNRNRNMVGEVGEHRDRNRNLNMVGEAR